MKTDKINLAINDLLLAITESDSPQLSPLEFVEKLPKRALSGDHINGGKLINFSSTGISDGASSTKIIIDNNAVNIDELVVNTINSNVDVKGDITANTVTASVIKADTLEVKDLKVDIQFEKNTSIMFNGEDGYGKGLLWSGVGYTKQLVFNPKPDRFFSSEQIDIAKGKHLSINSIKVIDEHELGTSITKSNIKELGRLTGLTVDGSVVINQYLFYNAESDRLGIGTDAPNSTLSIVEDDIEIVLGATGASGKIGTFATHGFDIVTGNTARISISHSGNIMLGNKNAMPINVTVHGTLGINVNTVDNRVGLHVNGAIKYNDKLHISGSAPPDGGMYTQGDICWNTNPLPGRNVGWVCTQTGSPGIWHLFGDIR